MFSIIAHSSFITLQAIAGRRKRGKGWQLLVKWVGWPLDLTEGWQARGTLTKCEALDKFEAEHGVEGTVPPILISDEEGEAEQPCQSERSEDSSDSDDSEATTM